MPLSSDNGNGTDAVTVTVADNGDNDVLMTLAMMMRMRNLVMMIFFLFFNEAKACSNAVVFCYSLLNLYGDDVKMVKKTMFNNTYHINLMQTFIRMYFTFTQCVHI